MSRGSAHVLAGLLLATVVVGCQRAERPVRNVLVVGSRAMVPLIHDMAARYQEQHEDVRIYVEPGVIERAINDTRQGLADIGLLGRALRADETGVSGSVLARDGIAFVVHRSNPIQQLPESHLVGLLTRSYTSWKDLGGSDRPVVLVGPGEGRGIRDALLDHFALRSVQLRPDPAVSTSEQVLRAVGTQPAALGYVSLGAAETFAARHSVRLLPVEGVAATMENVRSGLYPIVRPLVLLTREPTEAARDFLEFARSADAADLVIKHGFVPVVPSEVPRTK